MSTPVSRTATRTPSPVSPRSFRTRSAPIFSMPQADSPSSAFAALRGAGGALSSKLGMIRSTRASAASASRVAGLARTRTMFLIQNVLSTWSPWDSTSCTTGACTASAVSARAFRASPGEGATDRRPEAAPSTTTASTRSPARAPAVFARSISSGAIFPRRACSAGGFSAVAGLAAVAGLDDRTVASDPRTRSAASDRRCPRDRRADSDMGDSFVQVRAVVPLNAGISRHPLTSWVRGEFLSGDVNTTGEVAGPSRRRMLTVQARRV